MSYGPTKFRGKTWIFVAQAMILGSLALFGIVMGSLCLTGAMKRVDGRPATDAGIPLVIIGIVLSSAAALAVFNIIARRRPLLSLCREEVVVSLIGVSSLDGPPFMPGFGNAIALPRLAPMPPPETSYPVGTSKPRAE